MASGVPSLILDAELGIEMALLDVRLLARFLVEDMAAVLGGVRRLIHKRVSSVPFGKNARDEEGVGLTV